MKTEWSQLLSSVTLSSDFIFVIDCTRSTTMGIQAVYAPVENGSGILQSEISIDGVHYTPFPVETLLINSPDTSIWAFRDAFYNYIRFRYTAITGSIILSLIKLVRDNSLQKT